MLTNDVEMHLDHVLDVLDILDCGFSNFPLGTLRNASVPQSKGLGMAAWQGEVHRQSRESDMNRFLMERLHAAGR